MSSTDRVPRPSDEGVRISLVIPARNEEVQVLNAADAANRMLRSLGETFEVIVVDDGSTDRTPDILEAALAERPWLVTAHLRPGEGKGAALEQGFGLARGAWIAFVDADMQIPTEETLRVIRRARSEPPAMTVGVRSRRQMRLSRWFVSISYNALVTLLLRLRTRDPGCPLKVFPASLVRDRPLLTKGWVVDAELFVRAKQDNLPVVQVPIRATRDKRRRSNLHASDVAMCVRDLWRLRGSASARPRQQRAIDR